MTKLMRTLLMIRMAALIEAENQYGKVKFERDSLGRITKEWQGRHWISNQYNELGNCIQTVSSFGANILTSRNEMGQATQVAAYLDKEKPWVSRMEYNALGAGDSASVL